MSSTLTNSRSDDASAPSDAGSGLCQKDFLQVPSANVHGSSGSGSRITWGNLPKPKAQKESIRSARSLVIGGSYDPTPSNTMSYAPPESGGKLKSDDRSNVTSIKDAVLALFGGQKQEYTELPTVEPDQSANHDHKHGPNHDHDRLIPQSETSEQHEALVHHCDDPECDDYDPSNTTGTKGGKSCVTCSCLCFPVTWAGKATGRAGLRLARYLGGQVRDAHISASRSFASQYPEAEDPCDSCCLSAFHVLCLNTDEPPTEGEDADQLRAYAHENGLELKSRLDPYDLEGGQTYCCPESRCYNSTKYVRKPTCHG